jgi:hypothetical protein
MNAWFNDIDRAKTQAEIVAHARDYCSLVNPRDLEPLPATCRAIRIDNGTDIPRLHEQIADGYAEVQDQAGDVERLRDLINFLSKASDRLEKLVSETK